MARVKLLQVEVNLATKAELFGDIEDGKTLRIATLNPEIMLEAWRKPVYREALERMTHCTIDGTGLLWMARNARRFRALPRMPLELYQGATFVADLLEKYGDGSKRFYLVGGPEGLAEQAAETIKKKFPKAVICGAESGGVIDLENPVDAELIKRMNEAKADIVIVGFGAPKQELWISQAKNLKAQLAVGVGGTLSFYTTRKRAPQGLQKTHLEWLWRTFTEKGHARRAFRAVAVFPLRSISRLRK